jgi:predicted PurR-regulated permease PerM
VFASFLGFPANACHKMVKKIGFSNFWAPLLGTLSFLFLLICLFAALSASLARLEPDFPRYLDHIQERLTPILQAVREVRRRLIG